MRKCSEVSSKMYVQMKTLQSVGKTKVCAAVGKTSGAQRKQTVVGVARRDCHQNSWWRKLVEYEGVGTRMAYKLRSLVLNIKRKVLMTTVGLNTVLLQQRLNNVWDFYLLFPNLKSKIMFIYYISPRNIPI